MFQFNRYVVSDDGSIQVLDNQGNDITSQTSLNDAEKAAITQLAGNVKTEQAKIAVAAKSADKDVPLASVPVTPLLPARPGPKPPAGALEHQTFEDNE